MSTVATTTVTNAERIGKAVAEVAKRIRIQDFDAVGIQGTAFGGSAGQVTVAVQVGSRRELNKAAAYFQLRDPRDIGSGTTIFDAAPVTGLHGMVVEVFGPTAQLHPGMTKSPAHR